MDFPVRVRKPLRRASNLVSSDTLYSICQWDDKTNIAINHYVSNVHFYTYNYSDLHYYVDAVSVCLDRCIISSQFIGVNYDMPDHITIAVMIGICLSGHAFINIPSDIGPKSKIHNFLEIKYLFSMKPVPNTVVVRKLNIFDQVVSILRFEDEIQGYSIIRNQYDYAYGIFTSGTTGQRKIVKVPHKCIVPNILDFKKILQMTSEDKVILSTNFTFDPSIIEIFLAFSSGCTLITMAKDMKNNPCSLLNLIQKTGVTVLQTTPSLLLSRWTTDQLRRTLFSGKSPLRILLLGGEPLPGIKLHYMRDDDNTTEIYNLYGITEISCWASVERITNEDIDEGLYNLANTLSETLYSIRDENGHFVKEGEGSLYIGSNTRICAIDNEDINDLHSPVFRDSGDIVSVDDEGFIYYAGRRDDMIKRYGIKLSMQHLRDVVLKVEKVDACYPYWNTYTFCLHLIVYPSRSRPEDGETKSMIIDTLSRYPSAYMPDMFHFVYNVELNSSGKIDPEFVQQLCKNNILTNRAMFYKKAANLFKIIWNDHLKLDTTFRKGFLDVGGTSMTALEVANSLCKIMHRDFPKLVGLLLKNATIYRCIHYITDVIKDSDNLLRCHECHDFLEEDCPSSSDDSTVETPPVDVQKFVCTWQKCRGKLITTHTLSGREALKAPNLSTLIIQNLFNLKKCVDASPTMFEYFQNNKSKQFVTVGSHGSAVVTCELGNRRKYIIDVPDRIEASILVLDNYKGIIGCYDGQVVCVCLLTGKKYWSFKTGNIIKCTPIASKSKRKIFFGSYDHHVYCLNATNGTVRWTQRVSGGSICASGTFHTDTKSVLFGTLDGTAVALHKRTGKVIWMRSLNDPIFVSPVVIRKENVVFCTVNGRMTCFNIRKNTKIWKVKLDGLIFSHMTLYNNVKNNKEHIVVGSMKGKIYCIQLNEQTKTPKFLNIIEMPGPIYSTCWVENDYIFTCTTKGELFVLEFPSGKVITSVRLPQEVFSSPVVAGNFLAIGCRDDNLHVYKIL